MALMHVVLSNAVNMSVRFCLSSDPLKWDFIAFKMNFKRKHMVDMDVIDDVTCMRQSVITRMIIRFLSADRKVRGYKDEPGVRPSSVCPSTYPYAVHKHFRIHTIT